MCELTDACSGNDSLEATRVPLTCAFCALGSAVTVACLRAEPALITCEWCARPFEPDIDELLDGIDYAERELRLFARLSPTQPGNTRPGPLVRQASPLLERITHPGR